MALGICESRQWDGRIETHHDGGGMEMEEGRDGIEASSLRSRLLDSTTVELQG